MYIYIFMAYDPEAKPLQGCEGAAPDAQSVRGPPPHNMQNACGAQEANGAEVLGGAVPQGALCPRYTGALLGHLITMKLPYVVVGHSISAN